MSIESAKALYSKLTKDEAFLSQFEQTTSQEERLQMLQAAGYEFTLEEWKAALAEIYASESDDDLNDTDLRSVSGGTIAPASAYINPAVFKHITDLLGRR